MNTKITKAKRKCLFISPEPFQKGYSGSANRMKQTYTLLKQAGFQVDIWHLNDELRNIPKGKSAQATLTLPVGYDLFFVNYVFLLELFKIQSKTKVIVDIHDNLINRASVIAPSWFSRTLAEVSTTLNSHSAEVFHISETELEDYGQKNLGASQFFLPYIPEGVKRKLTVRTSKTIKFNFGFMGTQNFVNAKALQNIHDLLKDQQTRLLVTGAITKGLSWPPSYMTVKNWTSLSYFYNNINALILPIYTQTGCSTKFIEAMSWQVPVYTSRQIWKALGLSLKHRDIYPKSQEEFHLFLEQRTPEDIFVIQQSLMSEYQTVVFNKTKELKLKWSS